LEFVDDRVSHGALRRANGPRFLAQPDEVASVVLGKSTRAVFALTCCVELLTLAHYRQSIEPDAELSELWKDVFVFHSREESQHAILDELEWVREDSRISARERAVGVADLIDLVAAVDGILQAQVVSDADCFVRVCGRALSAAEIAAIRSTFLRAYRYQYIGSGVADEKFQRILAGMIDAEHSAKIGAALGPILG
jgi:hypothetical protein